MKQVLQICLVLFLSLSAEFRAWSQSSGTPIGEWRLYIPNNSSRAVAAAGNRIYCATDKGFFYFDKEFNSIETLSKINGLHDIGISTLEYDKETNTLLVAYQNTNLDLIQGETIINVNDILRKSISGVKTINHIYFKDKLAYLSCSFGLVVLDMVKLEIRDSYMFQNPNGSAMQVFATTILKDQIFAATSNGVMVARNNRSVNLNDLKNWTLYTTASGLPTATNTNFHAIAAFNGNVYAGVSNEGIYRLNATSNTWTAVLGPSGEVNHLNPGKKGLLVANRFNIVEYHDNGTPADYFVNVNKLIDEPLEVVQDEEGVYWSADKSFGLEKIIDPKTDPVNIVPNGPASESSFRILADKQSVIVVGGGYSGPGQSNSAVGFYEFKNGFWENYNYNRYKDTTQYPKILDLVDAVRNPVTGKVYIASYGFGVMEWNGPGNYKRWNQTNSPLNTAIAGDPRFIRVTDLEVDAEGNVWVVNPTEPASAPSLHVLRTDNTWLTFSLQGTASGTFSNARQFEKMVIDDNGYKWITLNPRGGQGLVVFDDLNNRFQYLTSSSTTGNLPGNQVYSIAKDLKGEIWVGTEDGIGVYFDPSAVFSSTRTISANTPVIGNRPLLEGQIVKSIAVDGANRKWVGTETGVWLFNPDGDEVVYNFTTKNSPLPSDKIQDIAVNHATGDVFISTEAGLASFRAGATITSEGLNCANVFPNPVRPGYTGQIAVSGIANNATVKITDITGTLVYETKALGGTAVWNGRDYNGNHVRSGVYLILSSNAEGSETCISKVAVLE